MIDFLNISYPPTDDGLWRGIELDEWLHRVSLWPTPWIDIEVDRSGEESKFRYVNRLTQWAIERDALQEP